ncbi:hypothetical protein IE53DRAFT_410224 [Violaceomyces palustris]|uniref:Uncharacterized protein n=1 Tax=Violaceomyces palustris TaxID=1673888 RepID=A0ACD0P015_9BASI|nr:hypothetical protein IE53DRAFT_410224 [Violaceomyces palustris]
MSNSKEILDFIPSRDLCSIRPRLELDVPSVVASLDRIATSLGVSEEGILLHQEPILLHHHPLVPSGSDGFREEEEGQGSDSSEEDFEVRFVKGWLTRLLMRSSELCQDDHRLMDRAAELLAICAGQMACGGGSIQSHRFSKPELLDRVSVKIRDSALVNDSLGSRTWGAAPILCQMILPLDREVSDSSLSSPPFPRRVLELGAGTGLVGLALADHLRRLLLEMDGKEDRIGSQRCEVVLTDFHPNVLENLSFNVSINGWDHRSSSPRSGAELGGVEVKVRTLDWQEIHLRRLSQRKGTRSKELEEERKYISTAQTLPSDLVDGSKGEKQHEDKKEEDARTWRLPLVPEGKGGAEEDGRFDMIIAADCIYDTSHPSWIRSVAEAFLSRPRGGHLVEDDDRFPPTLHMIVPLRPTHTKELESIYQVFSKAGGGEGGSDEDSSNDVSSSSSSELRLEIQKEVDLVGYDNFGSPGIRLAGQVDNGSRRGNKNVYRWFVIR